MKKSVSQTVLPWLKSNLGKRCIAPLTGTDARALFAAVHAIDLYAYAPSEELLTAFAILVRNMQPHTRELAFHSIAHILDWSDRDRIWNAAGLDGFPRRQLCAFEPAARKLIPQP